MGYGGKEIYYLNMFEGSIQKARLIDEENEGTWIKIEGDAMNTFIYTEEVKEKIFRDKETAEQKLLAKTQELKAVLTNNNIFIEDITKRLIKHEGAFYANIIKDILKEKCNLR